ncbi:MAG TPA: protein phosphatase 2C domain-containing protein [Mycobacteriales bacterium]|jgi:protein phosphatase|nr:protein phosphatase 2C domain-containing protein [Mycobacteriales bacterium]
MGGWRFGARTDVGLVRDGNEDSLYAGTRLLVVADGVGGSVAGEIASKLTVQALAPLDGDAAITDPLAALREAVLRADVALRDAIDQDPHLAGMGTTLTAILGAGDGVGLAQLGDSRAYLLRDGQMTQISRDHTLVQSLVDEGQITPEEAAVHPRRSWILRALDGRGEAEPDLIPLSPVAGDRYLLCSDGLSDYVEAAAIAAALADGDDPQQVCERLVELALQAGAPDNVTCIVAEPVDGDPPARQPVIAGAAATPDRERPSTTHDTQPPVADDAPRSSSIGRRLAIVAVAVVVLIAVAIGATVLYVRSQWYVANDNGAVAIYHGVRGDFAGISLSRLDHATALPTSQLTEADQPLLHSGQVSHSEATSELTTLQNDACKAWVVAHPVKTTPIKRHRHTAARQPTLHTTRSLPSWCPPEP